MFKFVFKKLYMTSLKHVTQFVVILNESDHSILYSANQQPEKAKKKLEMAQASEN